MSTHLHLDVGNTPIFGNSPCFSGQEQSALWFLGLELEAVDMQEPYEALETCLRQDDHS